MVGMCCALCTVVEHWHDLAWHGSFLPLCVIEDNNVNCRARVCMSSEKSVPLQL